MPSWIIAVGLYGNFMIFMGTIWLFNIAMENGPFLDGLPIKKWWFSMAMLNNQMVFVFKYSFNGSSTGHHWVITETSPTHVQGSHALSTALVIANLSQL